MKHIIIGQLSFITACLTETAAAEAVWYAIGGAWMVLGMARMALGWDKD